MSKQRLFEIIRKEDAVLWVGAGFSKYAGYPMGGELAKIIYNNFTDEEKNDIVEHASLQEISQALVNLRGTKSSLIEIMRNEFAYRYPNITKYHDILAKIPHIKTIITTNYDNLFEDSYGKQCVKIIADYDVPKIDKNRTERIKIHGDFSHENSLIITQEEYARFINTGFSSLIWNLVIERISTKSVVFLGYGLEDSNSLAMIEKLSSALGDNRKEMFFISPQIPKHKEKFLIKNGIIALTMSGEQFVEELMANICDNIMFDLGMGYVSMDTYNEFMRKRNIQSLLSTMNRGAIIQNVTPISGTINQKMTFTVSDNEIATQILNKTNLDDIIIPKDKIASLEYRIEGVRHPMSDVSNIKSLTIMKIPEKTTMDISFLDDELDFSNIPTDVYKGNGAVKAVVKLDTGEIVINFNIAQNKKDINSTITFNHKKQFVRPSEEVKYYELLMSVMQGKRFRITTKSGLNLAYSTPPKEIDIDSFDEVVCFLDYFKKLRIIEKHYGIIFDKIDKVTPENKHNANLIANHLNGCLVDNSQDTYLKLEFVNLTEYEKGLCIKEDRFEAYTNEVEKVNLHGKEIILGKRRVIVNHPIYLNRDTLKLGEGVEIIMECKANSFFVTYENDKSDLLCANRVQTPLKKHLLFNL
jgi:hypothetical protein